MKFPPKKIYIENNITTLLLSHYDNDFTES